ncbi:MAG: hypothetical protein Unbinned6805contig1000_41 [Prokaryotic dsDNA virus sp.]|nr:MAG: hypothetical protein Unbinned6805contig1000_41 [Prokaryotic dsDNA virus sp.]
MKTSWTKYCKDDGQRQDVKSYFNQGASLRKLLIKLLEDKISDNKKGVRSKEGYECPNWAYKQADSVGYERALIETISLIS